MEVIESKEALFQNTSNVVDTDRSFRCLAEYGGKATAWNELGVNVCLLALSEIINEADDMRLP